MHFGRRAEAVPEGEEGKLQDLDDIFVNVNFSLLNGEKMNCGICQNTFRKNHLQELSCKHCYCQVCLETYLSSKLNSLEIQIEKVVCPEPKCKKSFEPSEIQRFLSKENFQRLLDLRVKCLEGFLSCPNPRKCENAFLVDRNLELNCCSECRYQFCPKCLEAAHKGTSCHNNRALRQDEHFLKDAKKCPWCQALVDKINGCNHMHCGMPFCRRQFCYLCLKKLDLRGTGDGVNGGIPRCQHVSAT